MRKRLVIGSSWKMNKTRAEARDFVLRLRDALPGFDHRLVQAFLLPPYTDLDVVGQALDDYPIELGAQNMSWDDAGAFTGEISPVMLKELGCSIVMLGHSERRLLFGETDEKLNWKVLAACRHGLTPLLCVGETSEERDAGLTRQVLSRQLATSLQGVPAGRMKDVMILYEPRWAIGQKQAAPPEYIQEAHRMVRRLLTEIYDDSTALTVRVVYGGSVTPENLTTILSLADVDGCGVGRAAWVPENFAQLVRLAEEVARSPSSPARG